jgi:uridylate kinase
MPYKRILLKLTGEIFGGNDKGLDFAALDNIASYLASIKTKTHVEMAIVVGAGNWFRGREVSSTDFDRATADYIGMLGTVMNGLALQEVLERKGQPVRVMSSIIVHSLCESFIRRKALKYLQKGEIVILAAGTGNPFFTTDSAAALKAGELKCDILLKGSNVEGVYTNDPNVDKSATMYKELSYHEALDKGLTVMDNTAFALCQNESIPIRVFNLDHLDNIEKILQGEEIGTLIR